MNSILTLLARNQMILLSLFNIAIILILKYNDRKVLAKFTKGNAVRVAMKDISYILVILFFMIYLSHQVMLGEITGPKNQLYLFAITLALAYFSMGMGVGILSDKRQEIIKTNGKNK